MARYTGPNCRLCRRVGEKLFLKGERCYTPKCAIERRRSAAEHAARRRRSSDWAIQLREKQKARFTYGVLERQFRRYFEEARRRPEVTGLYLLQLLERRLDNVIYRMNVAESRDEARQLVRHGHFTVNGRPVNIPSCQVKDGDVVGIKEGSLKLAKFKEIGQVVTKRPIPGWLSLDPDKVVAKVVRMPELQDIGSTIDTRLIVEYYSR